MAKKAKLGSGKRFAAGVKSIMSGAKKRGKKMNKKNAAGIMAAAGRKKYGAKRFAAMATKGRRRK